MKNESMQQTSFWKFLNNHKIEIPIIQRDYVQGQIGKEKLRGKFLADLKGALDNRLEGKNGTLKMDFVYGSIDSNNLNPLDGQQRLTTLWLLHWYIAHKAGKLADNNLIFKKFSYETRVSTHDFCEKLSDFHSKSDEKIISSIQNQTWFLSVWKQDPTIQAMLNMLGGTSIKDKEQNEVIDGIEGIFENCENSLYLTYWEILINDDCPIIFYYLDLQGLKLSDDLYIKMNARGKPLTPFENFKADLVGYINEKKKSENPQKSIAYKLDVDWANIFWKYKSPEHKIDEIYFAFINRFLLNCLITDKKSVNYKYSQVDVEQIILFKHIQSDAFREYDNFDIYLKDMGEASFCEAVDRMETVLDNFYKFIETKPNFKENLKLLFSPSWNDDSQFCFMPEYEEDIHQIYNITTITRSQRVVFYAICCYFEEGEFEEISLKRWMRVVWNIVENGKITNVQAMIGAMRLIDDLAIHSHSIYESLANNSIQTTFAKEQMEEEKEKARKIAQDVYFERDTEKVDWEEKIIEAEKYAFFKGTIRFLYRTDDDKGVNWDLFDTRFEKAKTYFDVSGVKDTAEMKYRTDALLLKAFVSRVEDPWKYLWRVQEVFDNKNDTWKMLLTISGLRKIMNIILSGDLSIVNIGTCNWHKKLYETDLLSYVATYMEGSRVRDVDGHKAIYPARYPRVILDMDKRDNILSELMIDNVIEVDQGQIVAGMPFFRGWDINFKLNKYEDYKFQWNRDRNIYLLNNKNERVMKENQYLFLSESEKNKEEYIKEFENLIRRAI